MSDRDKTVRKRTARSTICWVGLAQFVTSGGTLPLRNPEIVR